jgi:hypothetical protein
MKQKLLRTALVGVVVICLSIIVVEMAGGFLLWLVMLAALPDMLSTYPGAWVGIVSAIIIIVALLVITHKVTQRFLPAVQKP